MSSLTLTDFEDSFFADAVDSKFQLSGWDEEKDKESTDEHEIHPASRRASVELGAVNRVNTTFSCPTTPCNDKPTPPVRRESDASTSFYGF